jgi:hypothetical protein
MESRYDKTDELQAIFNEIPRLQNNADFFVSFMNQTQRRVPHSHACRESRASVGMHSLLGRSMIHNNHPKQRAKILKRRHFDQSHHGFLGVLRPKSSGM